MKILLVSVEVHPFAKTGGLADVAGSLPLALARLGHDVRVMMPRYRSIRAPLKTVGDFPVPAGKRKETAILRESALTGEGVKVPVYFIDNYHYYDRDGYYCHLDDDERFGFLNRAALEALDLLSWHPDVIHCNDWQSGFIPLLLDLHYRQRPGYGVIGTLFTIHNLQYQGVFSPKLLDFLHIPPGHFHMGDLEFYGQVNFMKAGITHADLVNTVSERYAEEIQTEQYGERLEGLLRHRADDLYGIVNGIDVQIFNPASDPHLPVNYDRDRVERKAENKVHLQREMGLPEGRDIPVFGLCSRLVSQKGLELVAEAAEKLLAEDVQLVILGQGDPYYEEMLLELRGKHPDRVGVRIDFDVPLAQRIYGGSDFFLMPSRFEPCGLGQLIALRYGTVPVVRATGGLADTVQEYDPETGEGNGFVFEAFDAGEFLAACLRAVDLYRNHPGRFLALVRKDLAIDHSWKGPALAYEKLFEKIRGKRQG